MQHPGQGDFQGGFLHAMHLLNLLIFHHLRLYSYHTLSPTLKHEIGKAQ